MPKPARIAVIGAGIAGLTAATKLIQAGKQVTVFESSPNLGGRARTVQHKDLALDNGQHILLGAYHETLSLLESVGIDASQHLKRLPLSLLVKDLASANAFQLSAAESLPAPLHIAWGLLTAKGINWFEKISTLRFLAWLRLKQFRLNQDESLATLLSRKQQPDSVIQSLWEPLCLAALNTPMETASAQVFLNVLRDSFAKDKQDADLLLPTTDLTDLIAKPLAAFILKHGGNVQTSTAVKSIAATNTGYQVSTKDSVLDFSHVVIATGPHQLKTLQKGLPQLNSTPFDYQAITTVYLQYAADKKLPQPMIGMVNSQSQWVFDRGALYGQDGLMAVVISVHSPNEQQALVDTVTRELATVFSDLGEVLWSKVITEKRATFSCDVSLQRPDNQTAYPNLYLAGDYTVGDYPATIEGAVMSGVKAAGLILSSTPS